MFILAGEIMNHGGITLRLVTFAKTLVGHLRGGLAHVNIVSSMLFAGLSGSAVADTSALGSILIPAMEKDGYTRRFSAAVTAASSVIGPVIPPSIIMVVYAYIMGVSVGGLFAAGLIPGLMMGGGLMMMNAYLAKKRNFPRSAERAGVAEVGTAFGSAFLPLLRPSSSWAASCPASSPPPKPPPPPSPMRSSSRWSSPGPCRPPASRACSTAPGSRLRASSW